MKIFGLFRWLSGKEYAFQGRRHRRCRFNPWVGKIPWSKKWQPILVFLPGKFHEQRSLACCVVHGVAKSQIHGARLEFPREAGLILRCAGKAGNPFQNTQGIDSPVVMRRGEGAQMKGCQDPRCSPRGNPACLGNFGGRMKGVRYRFATQDGT